MFVTVIWLITQVIKRNDELKLNDQFLKKDQYLPLLVDYNST